MSLSVKLIAYNTRTTDFDHQSMQFLIIATNQITKVKILTNVERKYAHNYLI